MSIHIHCYIQGIKIQYIGAPQTGDIIAAAAEDSVKQALLPIAHVITAKCSFDQVQLIIGIRDGTIQAVGVSMHRVKISQYITIKVLEA